MSEAGESHGTAGAVARAAMAAVRPADATHDPERVLVVDDEETVRASSHGCLADEGYVVASAADGAAALELLRAHAWDVVLLDLELPGAGGLQLLEAARELRPDAAYVLVTARAAADAAVSALRLRAYDYLLTPFDAEELSLRVKRVACQRALARENDELRRALLPPLRERTQEIPLLVQQLVARLSAELDRRVGGVSPDAMAALVAHGWPGDVRELCGVLERAVVAARGALVEVGDLALTPAGAPAAAAPAAREPSTLAEVERRHVAAVLAWTHGNVTQAARLLGIDRMTLYNKIKRYGLRRGDTSDPR